MKQSPRTFKFKRVFRKKVKGVIINRNLLFSQYKYSLKALEQGKLTFTHLKMMDLIIRRLLKKNAQYKINIILSIPVSAKHQESRMGKGKGNFHHWECVVTKGMILLEINSFLNFKMLYALKLISERLPIKVKISKFVY